MVTFGQLLRNTANLGHSQSLSIAIDFQADFIRRDFDLFHKK